MWLVEVGVFGGNEFGLDPQVTCGFFNRAMGWICARDPTCMGLSQVLCQPHLPFAWPKHRGCAQQEMGRQCRRTELYLQGLNVINENVWAGLSSAYPNKQGAELIFHNSTNIENILREVLNFCLQFQGLGEFSKKFTSTWEDISCLYKPYLFQVLDSPLLLYWYKCRSSFDSCLIPKIFFLQFIKRFFFLLRSQWPVSGEGVVS